MLKDEQSSVKRQIEGSNELGIQWICYPRKAEEKGNPLQPELSDLEL